MSAGVRPLRPAAFRRQGGGPWRPRYLLFDLDGTLVDSAPDLAAAVNAALGDLGLPLRNEEQVRAWVGNGTRMLVQRAVAGDMRGACDPGLQERAFALFLEHYARTLCERTRPYPSVPETLQRLVDEGYLLACVTNKLARFTLPLLAHLGLARHFGAVISGDSAPAPKPDPSPLYSAAAALGAADPPAACREHALMVGDSVTDVWAARAAGSVVICVRYGYNHGTDILEAGPDGVVDSLAELHELLHRIV